MKKVYKYGKRGFASMKKGKVRDAARKGNKVLREKGLQYSWSSKQAKVAAKKRWLTNTP